ncbi:unnamed protein product [Prunus brigantina]
MCSNSQPRGDVNLFIFCHFLMYILRCNEITLLVHQFMKVKLEGNLSISSFHGFFVPFAKKKKKYKCNQISDLIGKCHDRYVLHILLLLMYCYCIAFYCLCIAIVLPPYIFFFQVCVGINL